MKKSPRSPVEIVQASPADSVSEKRTESDRRQKPTGPWSAFPPAGERMANRRAEERRQPYFVDRFSAWMLIFIVMLAVASIVDAVLTICVLRAGGDEINPVMEYLLNYGILPFVLGKYALTVIGLPLLLIFKNYYLFGTRVRVGHLIPALVALYLVLIGYQIVLIHHHIGWQHLQ
jgi:hypothetical protein